MEINLESVISLLDRAESDHDVSLDMSQSQDMFENGSQKSLRSGSVRGTLAKGTAKGLLSSLVSVKDKEADKKAMSTVINCVVKVLSKVYETVTNHGKEINKLGQSYAKLISI